MNKSMPQIYGNLVKSLDRLLAVVRLYKLEHPMLKNKLAQVFAEVSKLLSEEQSINFFESGNILLVNGKEVEVKERFIKRFMESFHNLGVGSLDLKSGLTLEEFEVFIRLLYQERPLQGEKQISQYLEEKGTKHIIPRYATYKMVEKEERIVKEGEVLNIDELPAGLTGKFLQDLKNAEVGKRLIDKEKNYQFLAHNPAFLSKAVFGLVNDKENPAELIRALWRVGDYLIDEIDTSREEEINRKILDELKDHLISLWGETVKKAHLEKDIQKTIGAVSTALQLKGLILLYQRHKKNLEKTAKKIREILKLLPPDSQLYQKTKEKLEKIDAHFF